MRAVLVAVVIGITILLPLTVFYGVNLINAPVEWDGLYGANYEQKIQEAKSPAEKHRLEQERDKRKANLEAAEKKHQRVLFFVAYPVGLAAFLIGSLLRLRASGIEIGR